MPALITITGVPASARYLLGVSQPMPAFEQVQQTMQHHQLVNKNIPSPITVIVTITTFPGMARCVCDDSPDLKAFNLKD